MNVKGILLDKPECTCNVGGTMFPYSHMTPSELANAGRDSGPLGAALAARIDELEGALEGALKDAEDADTERLEVERELEHANEKMNLLSDTVFEEIESLLSTIPEKTTHKGLIAIRERLGALKATILEANK